MRDDELLGASTEHAAYVMQVTECPHREPVARPNQEHRQKRNEQQCRDAARDLRAILGGCDQPHHPDAETGQRYEGDIRKLAEDGQRPRHGQQRGIGGGGSTKPSSEYE